jgi:hypothetical protein
VWRSGIGKQLNGRQWTLQFYKGKDITDQHSDHQLINNDSYSMQMEERNFMCQDTKRVIRSRLSGFCFSEGLVDLLRATRIHSLPLGVNRTTGMCTSRPGSDPDIAYSISEQTILTVQTAQLFPLGYPKDFSLLLVVRPTKGKTLHDNR